MKRSRPISLVPTLFVVALLFSLLGLLNAQAISPSPTGSWKLTGAMAQARTGAAAAALNSGNVLVTGGTDQNGVVSASAEIYGPTGTFTVVAPMNVARTGHTATWLANPNGSGGFVLVTGGTNGSGAVLASAELYDPLANAWTLLPALMSADNTGEPATPLPNSSVLLSGGSNSYSVLAGLESFSLVSQGFTPVGSLTTARKNHAATALLDGRVLILGGTDGSGNTLASTAIYDPAAGTVTAGPSLNTPRAFATATTLLDGTVLIAGGSYPEGAAANGNIAELNSAEIFDPVANTITLAPAKLAQARAGQQAFLLPNNSNVLLVGGTYNGATLASSELYTPWLSQFAATGSMSVPRASASGAALFPLADGQLLVAGGINQQPNLDPTVANSAELYGFATLETNASDYAPGTAVLISGTGWKPGEQVTITLNEVPKVEPIPILTTTADANGNIDDGNYAPNPLDLGIRYYALAVGATSGLQAENTFTDSYYAGHGVTFGVNPAAGGNSLGVVDLQHSSGADAFAPASCSAAACAQTSPASFSSNYGDTLKFTATPGAGYVFSSWSATYSGGTNPTSNTCTAGGTTNPCSFVVPMGTTLSATVTANFTAAASKLAFTAGPTTVTAGSCSAFTVTSQNSSGTATNPSSMETITLSSSDSVGAFYSDSGCSTALANSQVTIASTASAASFYFKDTKAGSPVITASGTSPINSAPTQTETVTAATASKLVFGVQPGTATVGYPIAPAVAVQVQDAYGNVVTGDSSTVNIVISGGGLSGTLSATAAAGVATFSNLVPLAAGSYTLSASDGTLSGATSPFTVNQAVTSTTVTSSLSPSTYGNSVTFTATVSLAIPGGSGTPTGTVEFLDGSTALPGAAAVPMDGNGHATLTIASLVAGSHSITALYSGDSNFASSPSAAYPQTVYAAPSMTVVTALNSSIYANQTTTITATVTGFDLVPGNVTFYNGSTQLGTVVLDTTTAMATWSLSGSQLTSGANAITAVYSGDSNYLPSNSPAFTETLASNQVSSGSSNVGTPAPVQTLTYSFTSDTTLSGVNILTGGIAGLDYTDGGSTTCMPNVLYTAGQSCTVSVAFTPSAPGMRAGGVTLFATGSTLPLQTWFLNGVGQASAVAIDPGTQTTIATLANSGTAGGSAVDAAGNVYVADRANGQVIKLATATFAPTTIVASGLLNPTAVALDGAGNLYISDTGNGRVAMVPNELGTLNVADLSAVTITGLGSPRGIAVDGNGYLYVVDSTNGNVIQVPGNGGAQVNVASGLTAPHGVAVDTAGNVYVSSTGGVFEYPFVAGPPITYGAPVAYGSGYGNPRGVAVDASGTVYVADSGNSQIVVVTPGGASQANLTLTGITTPQGVAVDASANLYISVGGSFIQVNRTLAAPLSFASTNIGSTSASQALTVTDVGNQQLTLSGLPVTANFTQTPSGGTDCSSSTSLGAAGQCLIATAFVPTVSGPLTGTVTLNDNALNLASTQTVQASGTGLLDPQNITFSLTLGSVTFGDGPFTLTATADSSLPVSYQVTGPAYISGLNQLVITGAGSVTVVASQVGDGVLWAPAAPVTRTITVAPANQSALTVTGMPGTAQPYGTSFTVGATGGSGTGALTFVASGACSNSGSMVTMMSGTGTCSVTAAMAADSNYNSTTSTALTVAAAKAALTVTASSSSVTYGTAVPTITASYSGFVSPDSASVLTVAPACITTYTTTTAVGTSSSTSCSGAAAANYAFNYVSGSVTISQEQTTTALQTSAASVMLQNSVTFTATVSGSTAIPSGSVTFLDGSSTIGTGTLDNTGVAKLTLSSLAAGSHSVTAVYASSVNFGGSSSTAVSTAVQDFNFTVSGVTTTVLSATVAKGGTAVYTLQVAPMSGSTFAAAVTLTLTGLPAGATYAISPSSATIAAGSAATTVTVTVYTSTQVSMAAPSHKEGGAFPKALVLAIFLPLLGTRKLRRAVKAHMKASVLMMMMLTVLTVGGMTACGGHSSQAAQSYAMTLTGTSGALQHAVTLNLTVQ